MKETKLAFIADTHYFSKTLADNGRQYHLRSGSDQKCLKESGDLIDAGFAKLAQSDCDAVLIAGDVTNDGETVCHEEFREKLQVLQKSRFLIVILYAAKKMHWINITEMLHFRKKIEKLNEIP